jgi:hypothetical protein
LTLPRSPGEVVPNPSPDTIAQANLYGTAEVDTPKLNLGRRQLSLSPTEIVDLYLAGDKARFNQEVVLPELNATVQFLELLEAAPGVSEAVKQRLGELKSTGLALAAQPHEEAFDAKASLWHISVAEAVVGKFDDRLFQWFESLRSRFEDNPEASTPEHGWPNVAMAFNLVERVTQATPYGMRDEGVELTRQGRALLASEPSTAEVRTWLLAVARFVENREASVSIFPYEDGLPSLHSAPSEHQWLLPEWAPLSKTDFVDLLVAPIAPIGMTFQGQKRVDGMVGANASDFTGHDAIHFSDRAVGMRELKSKPVDELRALVRQRREFVATARQLFQDRPLHAALNEEILFAVLHEAHESLPPEVPGKTNLPACVVKALDSGTSQLSFMRITEDSVSLNWVKSLSRGGSSLDTLTEPSFAEVEAAFAEVKDELRALANQLR